MEIVIVLGLLAFGLIVFKLDKILKLKREKKREKSEKEKFEKYKPKDLPPTKEEFVQKLFHESLNIELDRVSYEKLARDIIRWGEFKFGHKGKPRRVDRDTKLRSDEVKAAIDLNRSNVGPNSAKRYAKAFSYSGAFADKEHFERYGTVRWKADQKVARQSYNAALARFQSPTASDEEKSEAMREMKFAETIISRPCPTRPDIGDRQWEGIQLLFEVLDGYADIFYEGAGPLDYEKFKSRAFTFSKNETRTEAVESNDKTEQSPEKAASN